MKYSCDCPAAAQEKNHQFIQVNEEERSTRFHVIKEAGVDTQQFASYAVEKSLKGNLCIVYRLSSQVAQFVVRLAPRPGPAGGFFIKFLPQSQPEVVEHGQKRRELARALTERINETAGRVLIPVCCPLSKGGYEHRVSSEFPDADTYDFQGRTMTLWTYLPGGHLKTVKPGAKPHDPCNYSPEALNRIARLLITTQTYASKSMEGLSLELLRHELRSPIDEPLGAHLLSALGMEEQELSLLSANPKVVREKLESFAITSAERVSATKACIADRLNVPPDTKLEELCTHFLQRQPAVGSDQIPVQVTSYADGAKFAEQVFFAQRNATWPAQALETGKRLAQLLVLQDLVHDIQANDSKRTLELLTGLVDARQRANRMQNVPLGFVHQDAHPLQFLSYEGELSILDPDDWSIDHRYADLANVYLYKIVRGYVSKQISEERAVELLQAVLIKDWVQGFEQNLLDHNVVSLWYAARHLSAALSLDDSNLPDYNLAVTLNTFMKELNSRVAYDQVYRTQLLPKVAQLEAD